MKFQKPFSTLMSAALLYSSFSAASRGQQTAGSGVASPAPSATAAPAAQSPAAQSPAAQYAEPLTEDALRTRLQGKLIFLRGSYLGDNLNFDMNGKVNGSPAIGSFTLSAFEVVKVSLSKRKLEIDADRYGLHYFGVLPYEDETKSFDKVKISKKPVHITIEREAIVTPKVKKDKKKKDEPTPEQLAAAQTTKTAVASVTGDVRPETVRPETILLGTVTPAHSAMVMNKALETVFAADIDQSMMAHLPDYWQEYFTSKSQHKQYMPADGNIKVVSEGITPPRVLNSIDPSSNEYAQKFGIAGMELLRTVVDATGVPRQMAIARPIGFGLDEKAVDAIKNSRFRPATLNGQPVPVVVDLVVTFRIYSNGTEPGAVIEETKTKETKPAALAASVADTDRSQ